MRDSALLLFSAGQDSATCLAWALERFQRVETLGFDYGQRHRVELDQRTVVREGVAALNRSWGLRMGRDSLVDVSGYGAALETALTTDQAIGTGAEGLPTTFVPGRNLVFLSVGAGFAYQRGISVLVGGMCETDYSGYPDCRRNTLDAMESALSLGIDRALSIETPLMRRTKADTWALAHELGGDALVDVIVEHTHTCYLGDRAHRHVWGYGCAECPACDLRARGWTTWRAAP